MNRKFMGVIILSIIMILGLTIFANRVFAENVVEGENVSVISSTEKNSTVNSTGVENKEEEKQDSNKGIGLIAAALATGIGCIGAGIAVAVVASAAVGAVSENPSLLGKTIIFAGLAEGIAIYGLIISIMILNKV